MEAAAERSRGARSTSGGFPMVPAVWPSPSRNLDDIRIAARIECTLPLVLAEPLPNGVVGYAVLTTHGSVAQPEHLGEKLRPRRAFNLASAGLWDAELVTRARSARPRAVPVIPVPGREAGAAERTGAIRRQPGNPSPIRAAVSVQRGGAIRTDHAQILEPVVVPHPVDVVKDHAHAFAAPQLPLPAQLALRLLQSLFVEPLLQVAAPIR